MIQSQEVISAARALIGIKYHDGCACPALALDCAGVAIAVGNAVGAHVPARKDFSRITIPEAQEVMVRFGDVIDSPEPGCVGAFWYGSRRRRNSLIHFAIITDGTTGFEPFGMVHATNILHQVVEEAFTPAWRKRVIALVRYKEL